MPQRHGAPLGRVSRACSLPPTLSLHRQVLTSFCGSFFLKAVLLDPFSLLLLVAARRATFRTSIRDARVELAEGSHQWSHGAGPRSVSI